MSPLEEQNQHRLSPPFFLPVPAAGVFGLGGQLPSTQAAEHHIMFGLGVKVVDLFDFRSNLKGVDPGSLNKRIMSTKKKGLNKNLLNFILPVAW